ncbi:MAG: transglycosylase domain-containing protein [Candidatus Dormibacteria bacterium]
MSTTPPDLPRRRRARLGGGNGQRLGNGNGGLHRNGNAAGRAGDAAARGSRRRRASVYRRVLRPRRRRIARLLLFALAVFSALSATVVGVAFAGYNIYKAQLPDAATVSDMEPPLDSYVYDATGKLIYVFHGDTRHAHVALSSISRWVRLATVDVEDRHFFDEGSWDLPRLVQAGVNNVTHSGSTQGASTITQQLAKLSLEGGNLLGPTSARSLDYKIKEIVLGNEIAAEFSKDQVLEMYLNRVFYGNQATGIESAAEMYFQTDTTKLDLAQSAMLAGLPQSPSYYNPVTNVKVAKQRQQTVLNAMVSNGDITQAQANQAFAEKLTFHSWTEAEPSLAAGYIDQSFVSFLKSWLGDHFGNAFLNPGGWRIYTSLDPGKQAQAQQTVHDQVASNGDRFNMHDASLVSMDPRNGEVLAMVGAWDNGDPHVGQLNMATAGVTPGSSVKLFTYTAAIASGRYTMTTPILDAPFSFPVPGSAPYSPLDYDRRWHGTCVLKTCLGNSLNVPAVKVEYGTGIPYINNLELASGITDLSNTCSDGNGGVVENMPAPTQWSATLGGFACGISLLDLADGASTIADLGMHHGATPVTKITSAASGKQLWAYDATKSGVQVVPDNVAFIVNEITSNDSNRQQEFGAHGLLTLGNRRVSAKTGTGEFFQDNLTVGWTPSLLTAVWVGNPTPTCPNGGNALADGGPCGSLNGIASGITGAAPIWHDYMSAVLGNSPAEWYTRPANVVASGNGDNADFFLPGTQNQQGSCYYWGPAPDPSNPCVYIGTNPPPKPAPSPSPSPSAPAVPTPPPVPTPPQG